MNPLLVILLVVAAWFLLESGQVFFAFLVGVVLLFVVLGGAKESKGEASVFDAHTPAHKLERGDRTHRFTIKDPWTNTKNVEDQFEGMGAVFFWPIKQVVGFMRRHGR